MKKLYLFLLFFIPSWTFACMPPYPWEVMIGRIDSIIETSSGMTNIGFSSYDFPFREYAYWHPTAWHWQNYSNTAYPWIASGSLIIALSDAQDGSYPHDYSIFHITTLSCEDDVLSLGKRYGTVMGWDRKNGRCGYEARSLLDVFLDGDEAVWLKKLQEKYPTCDSLEKAFPMMSDDISPVTKISSYEGDIIISSTWFAWLDWILSKIDTFFGLFLIFIVYV